MRHNTHTGKKDWVMRDDNLSLSDVSISNILSVSTIKFPDGTTQSTAGSGGSGGCIFQDYGSYISQDATRSGDNVWIQNDLSSSNVLYVDESESLMTVNGAISVNNITISNNLSIYGTVDGRDVATDGAKLDGIEAGAQVNTVDSVNGYTGVINLTTGDVNVSTDKNYVTDAQLVVIGNTSGTNTGDQNLSSYLNQSTVFSGDISGNYQNIAVSNDSHNHTSSTITLSSTDLTDTSDILYESELDSLSEFNTQLGITGTPSSSNFLRGDGSWQIPEGTGGSSYSCAWTIDFYGDLQPSSEVTISDTYWELDINDDLQPKEP